MKFHHRCFYLSKYLLRSIVDVEKITQIPPELIAAFRLSMEILMRVEKKDLTCWGLRGRLPPAPQECWVCQGTQDHAQTSLHSLAERS